MMIDVSDPAIRREIEARLERELETQPYTYSGLEQPPTWAWHLVAHVYWLLVHATR